MSKKVSFAITDRNITVNYDGQTHIVSRSDELAENLISALREGRQSDIPNLVSAATRIVAYGKGILRFVMVKFILMGSSFMMF